MATELIPMKGEEFVKKLLAGERDFSRIKLEEGFDLSGYEGFSDLNEYLTKEDLYKNPVIINDSQLTGLCARGLYLPHVKGRRADLREADLEGADLREAYLGKAYLWRADLEGADLREAYLGKADLYITHLGRADLGGADLERANFEEADLKHIRNLEETIHLSEAIFYETRVTEKEKKIIEEALKEKNFVVE